MVDRDALSARLNALEGYLVELRTFQHHSREEFVRASALHHLAERIAHHVIADEGYRQPASYRDSMEVLREEGLVDAQLAERLKMWMGFRNVLVHFYLEVDHGRSHDAIRADLGDLEAFAQRMARLLGDPGED